MTEDRLLTSKEAARMLGIAEGTLNNWRDKSKGPPYVKDGHYVRYWKSDIREWAYKRRIDPKDRS